MLTRILAAALTVAALAVGAPAVADSGSSSRWSQPSGVDKRPCVSKREFNSASYVQRKDQLEARWEVAGLGRQVVVPGVGRATLYPRCGYSMDEAWYGAQYVKRGDGHYWAVATVFWNERGAQPHGRP